MSCHSAGNHTAKGGGGGPRGADQGGHGDVGAEDRALELRHVSLAARAYTRPLLSST